MKIWGVACFVVGVSALSLLAIRRGQDTPLRSADYLMMFIGVASVIAGLALFFVYSMKV
jgi:hypothetical protein